MVGHVMVQRHAPTASPPLHVFSPSDGQRASTEAIAKLLEEPIATVRNMAFKKRGLLGLTPEDIKAKIDIIAKAVDVSDIQYQLRTQ